MTTEIELEVLKEVKGIKEQLASLNLSIQSLLMNREVPTFQAGNIDVGPRPGSINSSKELGVNDIGQQVRDAIKKAQADARAQSKMTGMNNQIFNTQIEE